MDCLISTTENCQYTFFNAIGFGGSPRIVDIGGVPYLMPIADKSKVKHHGQGKTSCTYTYVCVFACACSIVRTCIK